MTLTERLAVSIYEVTRGEFEAFVMETGHMNGELLVPCSEATVGVRIMSTKNPKVLMKPIWRILYKTPV